MQPILEVNLSTGKFERFLVPKEWEEDFIGGASLAARILYKDLVQELDPLSPEAPLLFMNGPLTGTTGPAVGRFVVCARSPATGLWGESNCGGFWGPELRKAGFDGLLLRGRAAEPVYLWINDDHIELRPARNLWGKDTDQTQEAIVQELGVSNTRVAAIGVAGESQMRFALILCDHGRVAGRTGMGAVMGSKCLKAVAVKGSGSVPVAERSTFHPLRSRANRNLCQDPVSEAFRALGTASGADYFDYLGEMPKRYFKRAKLDEDLKITGAEISESILDGVSTCHGCVIACGRVVRLADDLRRKGAEYETLVGFGPNLWLNDPAFATQMGELCDRYGMDSISLSNTLGLAFSLYEIGIIDHSDTGGLALAWGNAEVVEELVHMTAQGKGFGKIISEGARALGRRFKSEGKAVQVNGLEVAYHDPRGASGMGLVYATSPRGACHNQSDYFMVDIGQVEDELELKYFHPRSGSEKAENVARHQDWRTVFNSLVMCFFANVSPGALVDLTNAACGTDFTIEEMMKCGERGWNLKRVINQRLGQTRQDDCLPQAFLIPYEDAEQVGGDFVPDFDSMLQAYYTARAWEPKTGYPGREKLKELGLDWIMTESGSEEQ